MTYLREATLLMSFGISLDFFYLKGQCQCELSMRVAHIVRDTPEWRKMKTGNAASHVSHLLVQRFLCINFLRQNAIDHFLQFANINRWVQGIVIAPAVNEPVATGAKKLEGVLLDEGKPPRGPASVSSARCIIADVMHAMPRAFAGLAAPLTG